MLAALFCLFTVLHHDAAAAEKKAGNAMLETGSAEEDPAPGGPWEMPVEILIVHSYSPEYPRTKHQHQGFMDRINSVSAGHFSVSVEYLDTNRSGYRPEYAALMADYFSRKYSGFRPTLIYVTDDAALEFAISRLVRLFAGSPVFFSGIIDWSLKNRIDKARITGVFERKEIIPNIDIIRLIDPTARNILFIGDNSKRFEKIRGEIETGLKQRPDVNARFISTDRIESMAAALQSSPERFVILTTLGLIKDSSGKVLPVDVTVSHLTKTGRFTILCMGDSYLYPGVLGGFVTSSEMQGRIAAELVMRYLVERNVGAIAPVEWGTNRYMFDSDMLDRTGLKLPRGISDRTVILNPQPSFFEKYRDVIISLLNALVVMLFLLLCISLYVVVRKNRQIAERENRLSHIIENSHDIIYTLDPDGVFTFVSPAWTVILGHAVDRVVGQSFQKFVHMDDIPACLEFLHKVVISGTRQSGVEYRIMHADGTWRWHTSSAVPLHDAAGAITGFEGIARDINERKIADEKLQESERQFRTMFTDSPLAIMIHDRDTGMILDANPAACSAFGLSSADEFETFDSWLDPPYSFNDAVSWVRKAANEGFQSFEWKGRKINGEMFWEEAHLDPVMIGGVERVISTSIDITDRKRAEDALRESETNFRTFFNTIGDLIVVTTPEGRILFTNPAYEKKLLYSADDFSRMHVLDLHPAERRGEAEEIFGAMFRGERESCPLPLARKDGELVPVETRVWFGKWNGIDCIFGVSKDLTAELEAQQRFERLFRNNPALMALTDITNRRFTDVNEAFVRTLGYTRDEVIGRTAAELGLFVNPEEQKLIAEKILAVGRMFNLEFQVRRRDGAVLNGLFSGEIIISQGRQFFLTVMIDVTERKRAEEALARSEELYRSIITASPDNITIYDLEGKITAVSPMTYEMFGYARDFDFLGKNVLDFLVPEDREHARKNISRRLVERQIGSYAYRAIRADGTVFNIEANGEFIRDRDGKPQSVVLIVRDVTERTRAEEALRESEARLRTLSDNLPGGLMYQIDFGESGEERRFTYVSAGVEKLHEVTAEEVMKDAGVLYRQMFEEDGREVAAREARALETMSQFSAETRYRPPSGGVRWSYLTSAPRRLSNNHLVWDGIEIDITERKLFEEALNEAKEAAESASRAKSEFLANMSHEIRTPMNPIMGLAHLLQQSELSEKQRDYVTKIQESAQLLLGIINDILDFSKIEAGRLEIESVDFNLETVLQNVSNMFARAAEGKGLELLFKVEADVPLSLQGDPLRLQQVIINLTSNAIKFTDRGSVMLKISVVRAAGDDGRAVLSFEVKDTGIGLSTDEIGRLFKAFTQADSSITRRFGGTGLGLAICRRLVVLMGGDIDVSSEPGRGSTFRFTVPLTVRAAENPPANAVGSFRGKCALIVDDNSSSLDILESYCSSLEMKTVRAGSGMEALKILRASGEDFNFLVIDWRMPGIDGIETVRQIQSEGLQHKALSIVMSSAYSMDEIREATNGLGIAGFLAKPVSISSFVDILATITGCRESDWKPAKTQPDSVMMAPYAGRSILLVEDNLINQQVAMEILRNAGFRSVPAGNGIEALAMLKEGQFDLVLMDLQMPEMDGFQATREIRSDPRFRDIPIIAMTAHAMRGDRERCLAAGMNDHTPKPIDPEALYETLRRWLRPAGPAGDVQKFPEHGGERDSAPGLPGIDVSDGLARIGGNWELFRDIVMAFYAQYGDASAALGKLLDSGDMRAAERLLHSIKGASGSIGAVALHRAAAAMEDALKHGDMREQTSARAMFEQELVTLLGGRKIAEEWTHSAGTAEVNTLDRTSLRALVERLDAKLSASRFDSVEIFRELQRSAGGLAESDIRELGRYVNRFDFKNALEVTGRILNGLK